MKFSIFGLQRSGTTFLEFLLKDNFHCELSNDANWKHSLTKIQTDHITFNIYKNPYTWIESIVFRDPADILVVHPHLLETGYNIGHDKVNLANLAKLYNDYTLEWIDEQTLVKYESLIDPNMLVEFVNKVPFGRKKRWVGLPKPGSLFMSEGFSDDTIPYYLEGKPTKLSGTDIDIINDNIDQSVFDKLGYVKIKG
jgi:hypothetical protein